MEHSLSPALLIKQHGMNPLTPITCPTCKTHVLAGQSLAFLTYWMKTQDDGTKIPYKGYLPFCSTVCILNFVDESESGHG